MTAAGRPRWVNLNTLLGVFWLLAALLFLFHLVPNHIEEPPMVQNPCSRRARLPAWPAGWWRCCRWR